MIFTNQKNNTLKKDFKNAIYNADKLIIASGYFGAPLIDELKDDLVKVANRRGCKIMIGMVFHQGLSDKQLSSLQSLDSALKNASSTATDNGVYISRKEYHGKIYHVEKGGSEQLYIGSSNFSTYGFESRLECTVKINDAAIKIESNKYLNTLFSLSTTVKLSSVNLKQTKLKPIPPRILDNYKHPLPKGISDCTMLQKFKISLNVDKQPASSLNLFFDKGRRNQKGLYEPRPWYEIEIGASVSDIKNPYYPASISNAKKEGGKSRNGEFIAYLKKGSSYFKVKMVVSADNGKNIASHKDSGGRETFGRYIKGQLENANVLRIGERITSDTLARYGKDYIEFIKISPTEYIVEF